VARRYRRSYGYHDAGREAARQHIREAEQLSRELGGTDKDVKEYFFSLPPHELAGVLDSYGRKYGSSKQDYAEQAMPRWRSGRTKMSGLVAGRLYDFLPPRMPIKTKYNLVKTLWEKFSPRSHKVLRIGPDAHEPNVITAVQNHIFETITNYNIPEPLGMRFKWLSMGDVTVQQQLLNHFLEIEKKQAVELTQVQLPVMLKHLRQSGDKIHRLNQCIEIGNHKFDLAFDKKALGVTLEEPQLYGSRSSGGDLTWLWWIVGLGLLWFLFTS
jgi:hypothetical protein